MENDSENVSDECEICDHLVEVCEVFGKGKTCKEAIDEMKQGNITIGDLMDTIDKSFDKDAFKQAWDRLVDEKTEGATDEGKQEGSS